MATNINDLGNKRENGGSTAAGKLSAEEFNRLVKAVQENQGAVFSVDYNGVNHRPDENGVVTLAEATDGTSYTAKLWCNRSSVVTIDGECKVGVRFAAIKTQDGERMNANYDGTLYVWRKRDGESNYSQRGTMKLESRDEKSTSFDEIDLSSYLADGVQDLLLRVAYTPLNELGTAVGAAVTADVMVKVTMTQLAVSFKDSGAKQWDVSDGVARLLLGLTGSVARTLHVNVTGSEGEMEFTKALGVNEGNSLEGYQWSANIDSDTAGILTAGVKTVEAWLTCSDGMNEDAISSDIATAQFVVVKAGVNDKTSYLLIQNLKRKVENYVQSNPLFSYVLFKSNNTTKESRELIFRLTDYNKQVEYFRIQREVTSGTVKEDVPVTIEIENDSNDTMWAYFEATDTEGNVLSTIDGKIEVDNTERFAPTAGAKFFLNPKTRDNAETKPNIILNAADKNKQLTATFSSTFDFINDGWVQADDGQRVLRVLSGRQLTISYDWLSDFANGTAQDVTLELDYKVTNVTNEKDPIFCASENYDGSFLGFQMRPLVGFVRTMNNKDEAAQNFCTQEGVRTHIAVNIVSALQATNASQKTLALCRVFINGVINREFLFDPAKQNWRNSGSKFIIGQTAKDAAADIDIYSIRVYKNTISAKQVMADYMATLPTAAEKVAFRNANAVTDESGHVSLAESMKRKKNSLIWHGTQPSKNDPDKKNGWLEIHIYKENGDEDLAHSGTICQQTKAFPIGGQGTTAKNYYYWNWQGKMKDVEATIDVDMDNIDFTDIVSLGISTKDGKQAIKLYGCGLGRNDWATDEAIRQSGAQDYPIDNRIVTLPDGWIDGYGKYRGKAYKMADDTNYGIKLVNKINYASSMQSHLMGANNAYNDLHKAVVGPVGIQVNNPASRICKRQLPFFYFTQSGDNATAEFQGPCTFGPGKMDDASFGYDKKQYPYFAMIEGAQNDTTLADFRTPWQSKHITYKIEDGEVATFMWNGKEGLDYDKGNTKTITYNGASVKILNDDIMDKLKEFVNFLYLHSPLIKVYVGPWSGSGGFLQSENAASEKARAYKWWCTEGDSAFCLMRYHEIEDKWVPAGWDASSDSVNQTEPYKKLDLKETYPTAYNKYKGDYDKLNEAFIEAIVEDARQTCGDILDPVSLRFHYNYINQFEAGTDNCSKNTYYILVPKKDGSKLLNPNLIDNYVWAFAQDDMDTIKATDNSGFQTKPYYIDFKHTASDEDKTTSLYMGDNNNLFNLCDAMWEANNMNRIMMSSIFDAMTTLAPDSNRSLMGFQDKYFFDIQRYFPAVAYNEAARIRYEFPTSVGYTSEGRNIVPISQSMGDQMQAEMEFMKKRIILFASYAEWGDFTREKAHKTGIDDAVTGLSLTGHNVDGNSRKVVYKGLIPHQYIYLCGETTGSNVYKRERCAPGEPVDFTIGTVTKDSTNTLFGANFFRSFGNLGDFDVAENTTTITGKRLTELTIKPSGTAGTTFEPATLVLNTPFIKKLNIEGAPISGNLDLTGCIRLTEVNTKSSNVANVLLPQTKLLQKVELGSGTLNLSLINLPALTTFSAQSYSKVQSVNISGLTAMSANNMLALLRAIYDAKKNTTFGAGKFNVALSKALTNVSRDLLVWLCNKAKATLSGTISLADPDSTDGYLTFAQKVAMAKLWGDIDNNKGTDGTLKVNYKSAAITAISITGDVYLDTKGKTYSYTLTPTPAYGNDVKIVNGKPAVAYSLDSNATGYAHVTDSISGKVYVDALEDTEVKHTLTASVTKKDGSSVTAGAKVVFKKHKPRVGDILYGDALIDGNFHSTRDAIGIVYMVEDKGSRYLVHAVSNTPVQKLSNVTVNGISDLDDTDGFKSSASEIISKSGVISPFDIDTIKNYTSANRPTAENMCDSSTADGFKVYGSDYAESDFDGKGNTEKIVAVARELVTKYIGKPMPTTLEELDTALGDIAAQYGDKYKGFYHGTYLAPTLFEPAHTMALSADVAKGKWHQPSAGEAFRIINYIRLGTTAESAKDDAASEALTPIFANYAKASGSAINFWNNGNNRFDVYISTEYLIYSQAIFIDYTNYGGGLMYTNTRNNKSNHGFTPCITLELTK